MSTFAEMAARITSELLRSNLITQAKQAINDAISEEAKTRFYFNEMLGVTFNTVAGQEYYPDMGFVEIDALYYIQNGTRYNLELESQIQADCRAEGNSVSGQLESYARYAAQLRLYPIPGIVVPVYANGYGKLLPNPLVNDGDTNAWLVDGERLIRARAKAIMMKEVIRDYSEATALEAIAQDLHDQLVGETTARTSTGSLWPTQW